jgi:hypothetical protein
MTTPWLVGWQAIGDYLGLDPRTAARKPRVRRAVSFKLDRRPRVRPEALDALIEVKR